MYLLQTFIDKWKLTLFTSNISNILYTRMLTKKKTIFILSTSELYFFMMPWSEKTKISKESWYHQQLIFNKRNKIVLSREQFSRSGVSDLVADSEYEYKNDLFYVRNVDFIYFSLLSKFSAVLFISFLP